MRGDCSFNFINRSPLLLEISYIALLYIILLFHSTFTRLGKEAENINFRNFLNPSTAVICNN